MREPVFDELVAIALDSPGPAAASSAIGVLSAMAGAGSHDAAVALGRIVAGELGLSCPAEAWQAEDPASVLAGSLPPLVKIFVLGYSGAVLPEQPGGRAAAGRAGRRGRCPALAPADGTAGGAHPGRRANRRHPVGVRTLLRHPTNGRPVAKRPATPAADDHRDDPGHPGRQHRHHLRGRPRLHPLPGLPGCIPRPDVPRVRAPLHRRRAVGPQGLAGRRRGPRRRRGPSQDAAGGGTPARAAYPPGRPPRSRDRQRPGDHLYFGEDRRPPVHPPVVLPGRRPHRPGLRDRLRVPGPGPARRLAAGGGGGVLAARDPPRRVRGCAQRGAGQVPDYALGVGAAAWAGCGLVRRARGGRAGRAR